MSAYLSMYSQIIKVQSTVFGKLNAMKTAHLKRYWDQMSNSERTLLRRIFHDGPILQADIQDLETKDSFLETGWIVPCCYRGKGGYVVATESALNLIKAGDGDSSSDNEN